LGPSPETKKKTQKRGKEGKSPINFKKTKTQAGKNYVVEEKKVLTYKHFFCLNFSNFFQIVIKFFFNKPRGGANPKFGEAEEGGSKISKGNKKKPTSE